MLKQRSSLKVTDFQQQSRRNNEQKLYTSFRLPHRSSTQFQVSVLTRLTFTGSINRPDADELLLTQASRSCKSGYSKQIYIRKIPGLSLPSVRDEKKKSSEKIHLGYIGTNARARARPDAGKKCMCARVYIYIIYLVLADLCVPGCAATKYFSLALYVPSLTLSL